MKKESKKSDDVVDPVVSRRGSSADTALHERSGSLQWHQGCTLDMFAPIRGMSLVMSASSESDDIRDARDGDDRSRCLECLPVFSYSRKSRA